MSRRLASALIWLVFVIAGVTPAVALDNIAIQLEVADAEETVDTGSSLRDEQRLSINKLSKSTSNDIKARAIYVLGRDATVNALDEELSEEQRERWKVRAEGFLIRARGLGVSKGRLQNIIYDLMRILDGAKKMQAARDYKNIGKNRDALALVNQILEPAKALKEPIRLQDLRYWSNPDYTRIVLYLNRLPEHREGQVPADTERKLPPRLFFDLQNTTLTSKIKHRQDVNDGLLKRVRVSQNTADKVRVVLDFESMQQHQVLKVASPAKIIIDVHGIKSKDPQKDPAAAMVKLPSVPKKKAKPLILIDAGHGGKDPGALGPRGLREKNITLKLAKSLEKKLQASGYRTILTRSNDTFLELFERTALANKKAADLFISIHADAAESKRAYGFTTFFLAEPSDRSAQIVAARENNVKVEAVSELDLLKQALTLSFNKNESKVLAEAVHDHVVARTKQIAPFKDLGVKSAPFYVMYGAQMPSILIESGFVSHPKESQKLSKASFVRGFTEGVKVGIDRYFQNLSQRKL